MEWLLAHPFALWLAVGAVLLTVEVATGSGWLLWPAGSAVVTAVLILATRLDFTTQAVIFAGLTILTTLTGRRLFPHATVLGGGDINDTRARLTGADGVAAGDGERCARAVRRVCAPTLYCDRMRPVVSSSGNLRVTFSSEGTYLVMTNLPLPRTNASTCMIGVPSGIASLHGHWMLPSRSILS